MIRGGSYYKPESSWWYVQGGPQSLDKTQIMLMVSPGFDRCATVGFRCVKDIDQKNLRKRIEARFTNLTSFFVLEAENMKSVNAGADL